MLGPANSGSLVASSKKQQRIRDKNNNKKEKTFEGSFGSPQCFLVCENSIPFLIPISIRLRRGCAFPWPLGVSATDWEA